MATNILRFVIPKSLVEYIETDSGEPIQTAVIGWHYGEPNEDSMNYIGKLTAKY